MTDADVYSSELSPELFEYAEQISELYEADSLRFGRSLDTEEVFEQWM